MRGGFLAQVPFPPASITRLTHNSNTVLTWPLGLTLVKYSSENCSSLKISMFLSSIFIFETASFGSPLILTRYRIMIEQIE